MKTEIIGELANTETIKVGEFFYYIGEVFMRIDTHQGAKALNRGDSVEGDFYAIDMTGKILEGGNGSLYRPLTGTGKDGALQLKLK